MSEVSADPDTSVSLRYLKVVMSLQDEMRRLTAERERYQRECSHLRSEIDHYVKVIERQSQHDIDVLVADVSTAALRAIITRVKKYWWVALLVIATASFGGYVKISDLIDKQVEQQVDTRSQRVDELTSQLERELVELKASLISLVHQSEEFEDVLKSDPKQLKQLIETINALEPDANHLVLLHRKTEVHSRRIQEDRIDLDVLKPEVERLALDVEDIIQKVNELDSRINK